MSCAFEFRSALSPKGRDACRRAPRARWVATVSCAVLLSTIGLPGGAQGRTPVTALPQRLSDTGLYKPGSSTEVRESVIAFAPQYALWSDGAQKRRWIAIPPGVVGDDAAALL